MCALRWNCKQFYCLHRAHCRRLDYGWSRIFVERRGSCTGGQESSPSSFYFRKVPHRLLQQQNQHRWGSLKTSEAFSITKKIACLFSGEYSCLKVDLIFKREFSYYLIQIYIPCCMLVIVSWVSFWLDQGAVPARVSLGNVLHAFPFKQYGGSLNLYRGRLSKISWSFNKVIFRENFKWSFSARCTRTENSAPFLLIVRN